MRFDVKLRGFVPSAGHGHDSGPVERRRVRRP
jgi:hypothetical protein